MTQDAERFMLMPGDLGAALPQPVGSNAVDVGEARATDAGMLFREELDIAVAGILARRPEGRSLHISALASAAVGQERLPMPRNEFQLFMAGVFAHPRIEKLSKGVYRVHCTDIVKTDTTSAVRGKERGARPSSQPAPEEAARDLQSFDKVIAAYSFEHMLRVWSRNSPSSTRKPGSRSRRRVHFKRATDMDGISIGYDEDEQL